MISITKALLALSDSPPIQLLLALQEWYPVSEMVVPVLWVGLPQILLETIDCLSLSNKPLYHRKLLFWRYITISVGSEDLAADPPTFNFLPTSMQTIWTPFEAVNPLSGFGVHPSGDMKTQCRGALDTHLLGGLGAIHLVQATMLAWFQYSPLLFLRALILVVSHLPMVEVPCLAHL